jgi:hypothetical protein
MHATPAGPRSMAPIFRRNPELAAQMNGTKPQIAHGADVPADVPVAPALVVPLHIFAAGRQSFDCIVRKNFFNHDNVIRAIFDALPLEASGWDRMAVKLTHIGNWQDRFPIWHLERA